MAKRARPWIWVLAGLSGVALLAVAAAVAAPFLIPVDQVRAALSKAVKDATGRELAIEGDLKVTVLPILGLSADKASLSNASWAGPEPMLTLGRIEAGVKLMPLLSGRVEVTRFVLDHPVVNLATDKQGRGNWEFQPQAATAPRPAPAPGTPAASSGASTTAVALEEVSIRNGRIVYRDGVSGQTETLEGVEVTASLPPGADSAFDLKGSATWRQRKVAIEAGAAKAADLLAGRPSPLRLRLASDFVKAGFEGQGALLPKDGVKADGHLSLAAPSLRELIEWVSGSQPAASISGLGPFDLQATLALAQNGARLTDLSFMLDETKGSGELAAEAGASGPAVAGKLAFDLLDLTPYMPPSSKAAASASDPAPGASRPAGPGGGPGGWSAEPIDLSALKGPNVDLALTANRVKAQKLETGKAALSVTLREGRLAVSLSELALYGGQVTGTLGVDANRPAFQTDSKLSVRGVKVEPLMKATADFDTLSGTLNSEAALSSQGRSQRDLVGALAGKGQFALTEGVLKGIDLTQVIEGAARSILGGGSQASGGGQTAFARASGSYVIAGGILRNEDLLLDSAAVKATGKGTVSLPAKRVDYRLSATASTGQILLGVKGGSLTVPVAVDGPWDNLRYTPDLSGIAAEGVGGVKTLGDSVKGRAEKLLPGLLGR